MATIIPSGITLEGELRSEDEIEISGQVRGKIETRGAVRVDTGADVAAEVSGKSVSIAGQLTGNVTAEDRVDLQPGGKLIGDVRAARLTIADGASFKGNVDMDV